MITIINNILSSNGYKLVDIELPFEIAEIYLYSPLDSSARQEYFITVHLYMQSDSAAQTILDEMAQELFDKISYSGKLDSSFEKNCTMLLCHEDDKITRQTILAIEEDQYNFKKNVITYAQQELEAIKVYLAEQQIEEITNSVINNIITADSGKSFLEFKERHKHQYDHYSLILKTALKLPFITYTHKKQELSNLGSEIESALTSNQLMIYKQLVNSESIWSDENVYQQVEGIWGGME